MPASSPVFALFCLLGLLLGAGAAPAEQHVKLLLGSPDEAIVLSLPEDWQTVSDARFVKLAKLSAAIDSRSGSGLVQAWEHTTGQGTWATLLVTSMPTGKFPETQLVEYERARDVQPQLRYERAANVVWTPGQKSGRGVITLSAIIPTERGSILLQAMGDPLERLAPVFERIVRSASLSEPLRYRHPGADDSSPPRASRPSWGTLVGIVVAGVLLSLWSHFGATLPRGWPRAARQLFVLLAAFLALALLTRESAAQSAAAGSAFLYTLLALAGLRALGSRLRRSGTVRSDSC